MAISLPHYRALKELKRRGKLPENPSILEIGEANLYDQQTFAELKKDLLDAGPTPLSDEAEALCVGQGEWLAYDLVKMLYRHLMGVCSFLAIDFHGTPNARKTDLNTATFPNYQCNLVYNHGTAEHIFNIANVFRGMHDACRVGGLMIHESPFTGWIDHGFYNLQPTLFWDVAAANRYQVELVLIEQIDPAKLIEVTAREVADWLRAEFGYTGSQHARIPATVADWLRAEFGYTAKLIEVTAREQIHELVRSGQLPPNAMLFVALRKQVAAPFQIPQQGVYGGTVSGETREAWMELR